MLNRSVLSEIYLNMSFAYEHITAYIFFGNSSTQLWLLFYYLNGVMNKSSTVIYIKIIQACAFYVFVKHT